MRIPAKDFLCLVATANQNRRVSGAAIAFYDVDVPIGDLPCGFDYLPNGEAVAIA